MTERNWDAELKKIDRQLESVSDEAMFPVKAAQGTQARAQVADVQKVTSTWGVFLRLSLTVALGAGMVFWPYSARCGIGLTGYLGAVSALVISGIWSSVWTFRHRTARAHTLSLLLVLWGLVLASVEVLPRTGYATPSAAHPANWSCAK
ncbi:MAG: hypothetical protein C0497_00200 [Gemmatimonas sp.]|nr:hypothetical protein [Gemmatimonas sp.]